MRFFANASIRIKLIAGFSTILCCMIILFITDGITRHITSSAGTNARKRLSDISMIEKAVGTTRDMYAIFADAFINRNLDETDKELDRLVEQYTAIATSMDSIIDTEREQTLLKTAGAIMKQLTGIYPTWKEMIRSEKFEEARTLDNTIDSLRDAYSKAMNAIAGSLAGEVDEANETLHTTETFGNRIMMFVIALGLFAGIGAAIGITRTITGPINRMTAMLRDIAEGEGDLTTRIALNGDDEIGEMARYFNQFIEKLQTMLRIIIDTGNRLAAATTELISTASQISSNANGMTSQTATVASTTQKSTKQVADIAETASVMSQSVNTVASAIEEMSASLNEVSKNCQKELQIAAEAGRHSRAGREVMQTLGSAAKSVGKVISLIDSIADQTNLLALNATIEAASAGDAGKGFTVVANEVKALAARTAQATNEIRQQIDEIQTSTEKAITSIDLVSNVIEEVNTISQTIVSAVEEQSATINEISGNLSGVSSGTRNVAQNVSESEHGLSEISVSITSVGTTVAETTNGIARLTLNVENLAKLFEKLQTQVSQFKV